jgi:hypothetical protein
MKKLFLILLLIPSLAFAGEVLSGFDNENLSTLNEQLRIIKRIANGVHTTNLSSSSITGTLPVENGGTGSTADANTADGVVINDSSGYLVGDGRNLTNLPPQAPTQVNDVETTGVDFDNTPEVTILSVAKTITSGKTVLLVASGWVTILDAATPQVVTIRLKQDSTVVQTLTIYPRNVVDFQNVKETWACCGIVTGLSGAVTFSVTGQGNQADINSTAYGNLCVLEF